MRIGPKLSLIFVWLGGKERVFVDKLWIHCFAGVGHITRRLAHYFRLFIAWNYCMDMHASGHQAKRQVHSNIKMRPDTQQPSKTSIPFSRLQLIAHEGHVSNKRFFNSRLISWDNLPCWSSVGSWRMNSPDDVMNSFLGR